MRVILQRVIQGQVTVKGEVKGRVEKGFVALVGVSYIDTEADAVLLAKKTAHLRVFDDGAGKLNFSALDVDAEVLVISQFTLYANTQKGRRPSFTNAAASDVAAPLVDVYAAELKKAGIKQVEQGVFGAMMLVEIHNDGPVTIILDTEDYK